MTNEERRRSEELRRKIKRDRVFLNNPVVMQGLGLAPLVVAATSPEERGDSGRGRFASAYAYTHPGGAFKPVFPISASAG